jgi:hypothetical protein
MTIPLDLKPIKARLAAATPGPWAEFAESGDWWIGRVSDDPQLDTAWICDSNEPMEQADIEFITHAPVDIAALIAEVERLRWRDRA